MRIHKRLILGTALAMMAFAGSAFMGCGGSDENGHDAMDDHSDDVMDGGAMHGGGTPGNLEDGDGGAAYLADEPADSMFTVEMTSFAYAPGELAANVDDVIAITIENTEAVEHDFTIDAIDADVYVPVSAGNMHMHGDGGSADAHFGLTDEGSGVVYLKVRDAGEYTFYCSVAGHRESGMEGTLTIQ